MLGGKGRRNCQQLGHLRHKVGGRGRADREGEEEVSELHDPSRHPARHRRSIGQHHLAISVWHAYSGQHLADRQHVPTALQAPGDSLATAAGIEVAVEMPFSLRASLAAPPRTAPLLLPAPGVSTAAALGGGGTESRTALPLRQPCLLTAALRVTAPCEASSLCGPNLRM